MGKRVPTIYTVADHAGVSIATVSRVDRGHPSVADPTARRVRASMQSVGYRPNGAARALAMQRHGAIGLVFPQMSGPYYTGVIVGLEEAAAGLGQGVYIVGTQGRVRPEQLVTDLSRRVDGLVLTGRTVPDELIAELQRQRLPVVLLARTAVGASDVVRTENTRSAQRLTAHLIEHGHKTIAFIGDPDSSPDTAERWDGFLKAHRRARAGAPKSPELSALRETEGRATATRLLGSRARPTALFCANDEIAMGAYAAAAELGLKIPADVAVTGWDDIPVARFLNPGLTTVRQPLTEIGAVAARLLAERVNGSRRHASTTVLPTEIIIRSSCGCQPQGGIW
jgi:LacI family transcriptional regulator